MVGLVLSAVAALVMVQMDLRLGQHLHNDWPAFLRPGPDGARQLLNVIASSMITVAGVVFSITMVALSLTANQYSPRVLRNFMRDRINQAVLGVFFGVFIYSLLVLQAVGSGDQNFVPQLALWLGVLLVVVAIVSLIIFIHHTATSIQVSEIIAHISAETEAALEEFRQRSVEGGSFTNEDQCIKHLQWHVIPSRKSGFIQDVDVEKLFRLACSRKVVLKVECPVGDFVVAGRPLVSVGGATGTDVKFASEVQRLFGIRSYRTIEQDPEFGIRQLVDIALRALSPGINDTTTAINCVDYLGLILHRGINIKPAPNIHVDCSEPRLVLPQVTPEHLIDVAFNEIRQSASGNVAVILRLLRVVRTLLEDVELPALRAHLTKHARLVGEVGERTVPSEADKHEIRRAIERLFRSDSHGESFAIAQQSPAPGSPGERLAQRADPDGVQRIYSPNH